ncbi:predicted protein [Botrytis cinerea T4]|uniref:Uncharacterized protein n=1 Tax=Botryotinia fuckeliana (strain T4) TaxID=999810 RepID=G2YN09_BOTF4|nr:predicted protein [Botrytis cinerea T4]
MASKDTIPTRSSDPLKLVRDEFQTTVSSERSGSYCLRVNIDTTDDPEQHHA